MIKIGDKVYYFQTMNRVGTVTNIITESNNQLTVGGTTEARVYIEVKYSNDGKQVGLLEDKRVYLVITSGGTRVGSKEDFLTPWLTHVLNFFGIKNIHIVIYRRGDVQKSFD